MAQDIKVIWDTDLMEGDISYSNGDLVIDDGLETAVLMSLFTDRRAEDDDELPDPNSTDKRGWWGDLVSDIDNDKIGSRQWLLERSKTIDEVLENTKLYAEEALQWMKDDDVVADIEVESERNDDKLYYKVIIYKSDGEIIKMKYDTLWNNQIEV